MAARRRRRGRLDRGRRRRRRRRVRVGSWRRRRLQRRQRRVEPVRRLLPVQRRRPFRRVGQRERRRRAAVRAGVDAGGVEPRAQFEGELLLPVHQPRERAQLGVVRRALALRLLLALAQLLLQPVDLLLRRPRARVLARLLGHHVDDRLETPAPLRQRARLGPRACDIALGGRQLAPWRRNRMLVLARRARARPAANAWRAPGAQPRSLLEEARASDELLRSARSFGQSPPSRQCTDASAACADGGGGAPHAFATGARVRRREFRRPCARGDARGSPRMYSSLGASGAQRARGRAIVWPRESSLPGPAASCAARRPHQDAICCQRRSDAARACQRARGVRRIVFGAPELPGDPGAPAAFYSHERRPASRKSEIDSSRRTAAPPAALRSAARRRGARRAAQRREPPPAARAGVPAAARAPKRRQGQAASQNPGSSRGAASAACARA